MVWMTHTEIRWIAYGWKILSIRCFTKNGNMPFKIGTKSWLKTDSFTSPERYGRIQFTDAVVKPLGEMTEEEAQMGGYASVDEYIADQMGEFNQGVDLTTPMIFYTFKMLEIDWDLVNSLD